jgi:integrase
VPIPAALRDHLVERKLEHGDDPRVLGGANKARKMAERGTKAMTDAKLEPLAIHDARHTYASLMIAAGVNAKALSEFVGHATIAITYDLYGHLMPRLARRSRRAARRIPRPPGGRYRGRPDRG